MTRLAPKFCDYSKGVTLNWKLLIAAASCAAVALYVTVAALAATPSAGVTIHLTEKDGASNFVDNEPHGGRNQPPSIGDMFAFTGSLWSRGDKRAGSLYASCVVTSGGKRPISQCTGTFRLAGGQLELQTTIRDGENPSQIAIVGGTGAYEGARGSVVSRSRGDNSPYSDDTIHLLPKGT